MEKVDTMPQSRGRKGYAEQAETIRAGLIMAGAPTLVATDATRNPLETLARYLRDFKDIATVVATYTKGEDGTVSRYGLYAEYKPTDL
jgi:hypothetical protein